jgi:ribonuclease HI
MKLVWYTDGACSKNGQDDAKGGFGVVCIDEDTDTIIYQHAEFHENTTNNRMEMMAIIHALKTAYDNMFISSAPIIRSDSAYAINTFTSWMYNWQRNNWKRAGNKPVENLDLVQEFYMLQMRGYTCLLEKVTGHSGNKWNEYCDELATNKRKT